jgi:hypothetical protein
MAAKSTKATIPKDESLHGYLPFAVELPEALRIRTQ